MLVGATSDKYRGTIYEDAPTPRPMINLLINSHEIVGANAIIMEPTVKIMSAIIITGLRPK